MRTNSAFSLVELMCAIVVLGVGIVGLTRGMTTALTSNKEAELLTSAVLVAEGQLETLRAEGLVIDGRREGDAGDELPLFRWIETISATSIPGLHEVAVAVEHKRTGQQLYELRTLLFDPPLDTTTSGDQTPAGRRDRDRDRDRKRGAQ